MAALRKWAEPERPPHLARYPAAYWDEERGVWRDGEFWFDVKAAERSVAFFPRFLKLTTGEWSGKPFHLATWQADDIVRPVFGWKRPDGTRRYRRAFVWVPRKNGKTELAAGIAILLLIGDAEPGGQVFSIASDLAQASLVWAKAKSMIESSPELSALVECLSKSIYCDTLEASFRPLSGKPKGKHGLNMSGLVGDEIHEWASGDLYTFVHDSSSARRQPLEFLISTAGVKGSHGEEVYRECEAIVAGDIDDPETLVVIYGLTEEDDWTDPAVHARVNPNWGTSVKPLVFASEFRRAQQIPRLEGDFKRYRLNGWTDQAVRWLPIDAVDDNGRRFGWDHCKGDLAWQDLDDHLKGKRCYGGLDLSSSIDLSALIWFFPRQDGLDVPAVLCRFFKPEAYLKAHGERDRLNYEAWAKPRDGSRPALLTTPGNVIDFEFIRKQVMDDAARYAVAFTGEPKLEQGEGGLAIDRWNAIETSVKLTQEGLPVVLMGQGFASLSAPSKVLEALCVENGFHHGGHPILRQHAKAVTAETDPAGNYKPSKAKSTQRIDGIAGLVNALAIAARDRGPTKKSFWEKAA